MGRDASTIYRDIKRNRYTDTELPELNGYHAVVAQDKYEQRNRQSKPIMETLIDGLTPLPKMPANRSPSTVAQSSRPDGASKLGSEQMPGFSTHKRRIKKVTSRTPTTGCGATCSDQPNQLR